jgi:hypothetical protein
MLFNLVSGVPSKQNLNTKDSSIQSYQSKTPDDSEEEYDDEEEDEDEVNEPNDILYDEPIELKQSAIIPRRSNGIRITSIDTSSFLIIGFIFSICSF